VECKGKVAAESIDPACLEVRAHVQNLYINQTRPRSARAVPITPHAEGAKRSLCARQEFKKMKLRRKYRYIVFKIDVSAPPPSHHRSIPGHPAFPLPWAHRRIR
jgi:hypothetical protein